MSASDVEYVRSEMLERVAQKSTEQLSRLRQVNEPDLSLDERRSLVDVILTSNPQQFLARFSALLTLTDLTYFDALAQTDYTINFLVNDIRRRLTSESKATHALIKNRRYEAMRRLEAAGEYFSDEEMKRRDPLLYEQMIGQYLTDEDVNQLSSMDSSRGGVTDSKLSDVLLSHLQVMQNNELYTQQKHQQETQQLQHTEHSDIIDDVIADITDDTSDDDDESELDDTSELSDGVKLEREILRSEFIETMKQRFLNGEETEFCYSEVDKNTDYDSVEQLGRDAEDKYFDEDDSNTCCDSPSPADYDY